MSAIARLALAATLLSFGTSCAGRMAADGGAAEGATAAVEWRHPGSSSRSASLAP